MKSLSSLDPQVKWFVARFLHPKLQICRAIRGENHWSFLLENIAKIGDRWPIVADLLQRSDYEHFFVNTLYWRIIAAEVKRRAGWTCQRCGRRATPLDAHHLTYEHHGFEHLHLDELQAICTVCHRLDHDLVTEAIIAEFEWVERQDDLANWKLVRDGFERPDRPKKANDSA